MFKQLRIFISGQRAFGAAVLDVAMKSGHTVVGVAAPMLNTTGDRPDRLRDRADFFGVPILAPGTLRRDTLPEGTDLIVSAHSHDFIGRPTRMAATIGAIGYHPSLLPVHRGRDAVAWTIKLGDKVAGGSIYWLTDNVDCGELAAQEYCFVRPGTTPAQLWRDQLFPIGLRLFRRVFNDLANGVVVKRPQDEACATWEPSIGRAPLFRPELPQLGVMPAGFTVTRGEPE